MFVFLRLFVVLFAVLTVLYFGVSLYAREMHRANLKRRWKEKGLTSDRDAFIQRGLKQYDRSFRRRLIMLIYIVPLAVIGLIIYVVNFK